ncbi:MAG TPA: aliphatic sulfonate ABC transporter substrate-binding protein [Microvirga sp.]|jgi:NitT/TauT family transport system substrate-binding protein|nr:aliphatic sulfonate ABC transporter substrate-binding protein [Microvirga sp.]
MLTRRHFLTTAAVAAAGATSLSRPASAAAGEPRIGYIADFPGASLFAIAADQKLWEANNLKPDLKVFTNGPIQIQALGAGSLDFGSIGPGPIWMAATGRTKIVAVNVVSFSDRVIAQPGINSMADLKGKKVGVTQGASGEMILRLGLAKAGMTIQDIQIVPMDPGTVVAAFSSGQIDGAGIWYPLVETIRGRVPNMKELVSNNDFYPDTSFINPFIARNEVVRDNPELVKAYLRVLKKAMDYRAANLDRSVELTSAFLGVPAAPLANVAKSLKLLTSAELVQMTQDGTVNKWLTKFNAMFKEFGTAPNPLPPEQYYEGGLFVSA